MSLALQADSLPLRHLGSPFSNMIVLNFQKKTELTVPRAPVLPFPRFKSYQEFASSIPFLSSLKYFKGNRRHLVISLIPYTSPKLFFF